MKKNAYLIFCAAILTFSALAQTPSAPEIPLIPRELFFDNPEVTGAQLSPDARRLTFLKAYKGTLNVWVKAVDAPFDQAKPITADSTRPIRNYFWSSDSKYVLYAQDKGGNEDFHIFAVDPAGPTDANTGTPAARDLTPLDGARAVVYNVSKKDPNILWAGINLRDKAWDDLYELNIKTGERKLLRQNNDRITGWIFDWDENLRLAIRSRPDGGAEIMRVDPDGLKKIYETGALEEAIPLAFAKDNDRLYLATNKGADKDRTELLALNPADGSTQFVESDPLGKADFGGANFSQKTRLLTNTWYTDAKTVYYWKNRLMEADYLFLKSRFPGREISMTTQDKEEFLWLIGVSGDTDPGETWLFDRRNRKLTFQYRSRPKIPVEALSPMEAISYPSSDGLTIPAYLTIPKGSTGKNLPLIVAPHGGPWSRSGWGYNASAQFWANRGYAVLQPNFRASTGYGKKFLNAGNRQWGEKMQDDITWGVKYLTARGVVDSARAGIVGTSYGGYATLAGVVFTPDLYKAAVAIAAPSNMVTLLASIPPYWESIRQTFYLRMGDPNTPDGKTQLQKQSPLTHVRKIKTPLMVVQGANDPRVKQAEAEQIVAAMRKNHIPVTYLLAPDEGHGFARPVNNMAQLAASEKFLSKYLGGRYQESMTPEVAKRLQEITVLEKPAQKELPGDPIPLALTPNYDLWPFKRHYQMNIVFNGQHIKMDMTKEVANQGKNWVVNSDITSDLIHMTDTTSMEKGTLQPAMQSTAQGPNKTYLQFTPNRVVGFKETNGRRLSIDTTLAENLTSGGTVADLVIGACLLKDDVVYGYNIFDTQSLTVKKYTLKIVGRETVAVPAGSYETVVVETGPADGVGGTATYWMANGIAVKTKARVGDAGGGAEVITELTR